MPESKASSDERLHALDAVRGFALLLGIVLHGAMSFLPGLTAIGWPITDASPSDSLGIVFYVIHIFRMSTFFLIAGFFAHLVFHRHGAKRFIHDRAKRIGVPLILLWLPVVSLVVVPMAWAYQINPLANSAKLDAAASHYAEPSVPLLHFWFLYVLIWLYAMALLLRGLAVKLDPQATLRAWIDRLLARVIESYCGALVLAIPIAVVLVSIPKWLWWMGIPTPDGTLIPLWFSLLIYFYVFCLGWLMDRQRQLLRTFRKQWVFNLALGLATAAGCLSIAGWDSDFVSVAPVEMKLAYAALYAVSILALSFGFIGAGMAFFNKENPLIRYLADASYWMYVWHLPVVFFFQVLLMDVEIHWAIKFPLILILTCVPLVVSYDLFVRPTRIGEAMNGRRYPRGLPQMTAEPRSKPVSKIV